MTAMIKSDPFYNPLDIVESVIMDRDWSFDRPDDAELIAEVAGQWCKYNVWFDWQEEHGTLSLTCSLDTKFSKSLLLKMYALLGIVNEKLWLGHFTVSAEDATVSFRHSLLLRDGAGISAEQLRDLLDMAVEECERFYPAYQSVVWGGKSPEQAVEMALFETVAEA